ncbi:Pyridoxal phosphate biosynthetic protein PdxA [Thermoanaerobacter sp. YS13]|uniref:4-hydroxythreonine-4-phosphate dehydrogenase PdxA n=1 Tax=Thermoanaerobacter sp. YS13 TaxID=1511746 RepID=UPI000574B2A6|nr:4-hydroxythreonine-4-phosphate dehydrogenase PdxA [Thermoanaerobacter sp. YS13]KHO63114.1 Pyridoxal phosphate biosynthetic protein PdxA [Thermoanaerobacter sp. YS13]
MVKPLIGITMGDAAGVRPEIIMKALSDPQIYKISKPVVIGDAKMLQRAESFLKTGLLIKAIQNVEEAEFKFGVVNCIDLIIRISVNHGTAFDIAGKGIADEKSMKEAIRQAAELIPQKFHGSLLGSS